jgi:hypothetical protein
MAWQDRRPIDHLILAVISESDFSVIQSLYRSHVKREGPLKVFPLLATHAVLFSHRTRVSVRVLQYSVYVSSSPHTKPACDPEIAWTMIYPPGRQFQALMYDSELLNVLHLDNQEANEVVGVSQWGI